MQEKNAWSKYDTDKKKKKVMDFAEEYRQFLSQNKTERECTEFFIAKAKKAGFKDLDEIIKNKKTLQAGDRVFRSNHKKGLAMFVIGSEAIENGMNILGAHIDSPRLDLKQVPVYEDTEMVLLDTHYYGGIKKYQWVTIPLALHGVVVKKDGTIVKVAIGDKPTDPVFGVSDLLIHLAADQMDKKASKVIEGEDLNVLIGSMPLCDEKDSKEDKEKCCKGRKVVNV